MTRSTGFSGDLWAVHPRYPSLAGLKVFSDVSELPTAPDAVFLNVSKDITLEVVAKLADTGAGGGICFAAGFSETGQAGRDAQRHLVERAGTLALVGPNSNGLINFYDKLALWPTLEESRPPSARRCVAIVSQSGGLLYNYLSDQRSVSPGYLIGAGNQALLDMSDYVDVLADDSRVKALGLFIEDLGDVAAFTHAATKAIAKNIPIVALKTGASSVGAEVARTHSGALSANDELYNALFQRLNVIRVHSVAAFDETLKMLTTTSAPKGRRVAMLTNSGGEKALAADTAKDTVLEFAPPSPSTAASLADQMPPFASVSNPLDYNDYYPGSGPDVLSPDNPHLLVKCFKTLVDDHYDIVVMLMGFRVFPDGRVHERCATFDAWIEAVTGSGKSAVLASVLPEHLPLAQRQKLIAHDIAPLQGLDECVNAIDAVVRWHENKQALGQRLLPSPRLVADAGRLLNEFDSKSALRAFGIVFPSFERCLPGAATERAHDIGYPVVLKALDPLLPHKAKAGAVALCLKDKHEVEQALHSIKRSLLKQGLELREVLVEAMVLGGQRELFLGVNYSNRFGHSLVFGLGGVDVETNRLVDTLLLPSDQHQVTRFIDQSKCGKLLSSEVRQAIVSLVGKVATFVAASPQTIINLDINPIVVTLEGEVVPVDALLEISQA